MGCRDHLAACLRNRVSAGFTVLAILTAGCGGGTDYYYVNELKGEGDTLLLVFMYTCGLIDVSWNGAFVGLNPVHAEMTVSHDDLGGDCEEDPREVSFDVGPMKQTFRQQHPWPEPLGVRVAPYEEEQGAICLSNLFQDEPFKGQRCR